MLRMPASLVGTLWCLRRPDLAVEVLAAATSGRPVLAWSGLPSHPAPAVAGMLDERDLLVGCLLADVGGSTPAPAV